MHHSVRRTWTADGSGTSALGHGRANGALGKRAEAGERGEPVAVREKLEQRALLFARAAVGGRGIAVVDTIGRLAHRLVRVLEPFAGRRARQRHQAAAGRWKTASRHYVRQCRRK